MRFDLQIIASWIDPDSTVLGLGCGEGDLLLYLKQKKQVKETGIEIVEERVARCIEKGLSVLQGDINEEVLDYPNNTFDYVILSQTLQQVYEPARLIEDMLRIGKKVIVSFPNFGHWRIRTQILLTGRTPVTRELPYEWYDTPNIRVLSTRDFKDFIKKMGFHIEKSVAISPGKNPESGKIVTVMPNLFATNGIFQLGKEGG
ncbi:MAG: methionine biosynthesis protein MetW [Thermodesulfobacteriota bacterium]|nr:methionine biosynthesis protein MetW [Thermodesulfobacteriota bacterium]